MLSKIVIFFMFSLVLPLDGAISSTTIEIGGYNVRPSKDGNYLIDIYASNKQRIKNIVIRPQVNFEKKLEGPSGPNNESELPPPNADPRSEPLPCCNIIEPTIMTAKITSRILINIIALS